MRSGRWKYIREGKAEFLHDLSVDEREQANYADSEAKKLGELRGQFNAWESQMMSYPKTEK